ncbi:MAG: DUF11 domain-containing protein [Phycisphaerae bacterium]|nr:DUF11 domain-containing protein [Phycisphaerae bacterium]
MKKVWAILFLVPVMLLSGCRSTSRDNGDREFRPAAASGRTQFWDSDLRPTMALPPSKSKPKSATARTPAAAESDKEPVAKTAVESATTPSELLTASVEPIQSSKSGSKGSTSDKVAPVGGRLVSMDDSGGHVLSMTYPRPDFGIIQVDKTMPEEVRLNTPFSYLIKISNLTDTVLTDLVVTETISKDFEFKAAEPAAQAEGNKLVWLIDTLGPNANKSIRINGIATASKSLEQSTAITHTMRGSAAVKVVEPTLALRKVAPAEALVCEPIQVEYVVTNTGTGAAQNVQVVDNLPAGMLTADGKGKIVLDAGTLAADESRQFSIKLRATKTGVYVGKATAGSASGLKAESDPTTTNVRQPILTLTKAGPTRQYLGRSVAYEITVFNKGDGPAQNMIIEDIVPPGVANIEATTGAQFSGSKLIWELGTLEPNTSKKVRVSYTPAKEGDLMASATASAYCAEPVADSAKTTITGIASTRLEVVDVEDPVEVGSNTTYIITASNEGSAADSNIRIVCQLDDKVQFVTAAGATAGSLIGKTVSFAPLRSLEPKTKASWRVIVKGLQAGDVRFKAMMHTDQLALPLEAMEATHIYQQNTSGK